MMLNGQSGPGATGAGTVPAGASQSSNGRPALDPSRPIRGTSGAVVPGKLAAVPASTNSSFAPESASMPARLFAVSPGASGATTAPARSAPRKTAAYSTEALAQI